MVRRDISAIKFDRVKNRIYFIFFFYWLKPLTDEVFSCEDRVAVVFRCDYRVTVCFVVTVGLLWCFVVTEE